MRAGDGGPTGFTVVGALERPPPLSLPLPPGYLFRGGGTVQSRTDEVLGVFDRATDAVAAALDAQRRVLAHEWPDSVPLRARMGIHSGDADLDGGEYTGLALHRTARICAAGHGGQVLLSRAASELLQAMPEGCSMLDLGLHALRDLDQPEHLAQLRQADLPPEFPPLRGDTSRPLAVPRSLTSLIGRDTELDSVVVTHHSLAVVLVCGSEPPLAVRATGEHTRWAHWHITSMSWWVLTRTSLNLQLGH
jgi:hypothetical protein